MYRRPKFLEVLLRIREEMAREADYDVEFFMEMVRSGIQPATDLRYSVGEGDGAVPGKRTRKSERSKETSASAAAARSAPRKAR
jgi:hypothetical protein